MFDPQRADPFFLRVLQNAPPPVVQAVGTGIRTLLNDGPDAACDLLRAARSELPAGAPTQKILSSLQVGIESIRALRSRDPDAAYEHVWNRRDGTGDETGGQSEYVLSRETQVAAVNEMRRQIVARANAERPKCPCCGEALPQAKAMAPLVLIDQQLGHLNLYVDMQSIRTLMLDDPNITEIDLHAVNELCTILAKRAGLGLPVAVCDNCHTSVLAFPFAPDRVAAFYRGDGDERTFAPGKDQTFTAIFGRGMFPHWLVAETGVGPGARVFDFGCGRGLMLKHLSLFGAEVHGLDLDLARIQYAREVLGLDHALDSVADYEALPARSFDLVMSSHTLEHVTGMDGHVRRLCDLVRPGGHLAIAVPNGELTELRKPEGPLVYPMLGGDHVTALTPETLARRTEAAGLETVLVRRGPARIVDPAFDMTLRDPITGFPAWTEAEGDFVLLARRPA